MPSQAPLPTLRELLDAYGAAVREQDEFADTHRGSRYDVFAGLGALVFRRLAQRDQALAQARYFTTARRADLDEYVREHYPEYYPRQVATAGQGVAKLERPSALAGAGVVWEGTRIEVVGGGGEPPIAYKVASDVTVGASTVAVDIPIVSVVTGAGAAIEAAAKDAILRLADPLWDDTWSVRAVKCGPGQEREQGDEWRARIRTGRRESRVGYRAIIERACREAGASQVVAFTSRQMAAFRGEGNVLPTPLPTVGADDISDFYGLNFIVVGGRSHVGSPELVRACTLALERVRVAGAWLQVLPMKPAPVTVTVEIRMWSDPGRFHEASIREQARAAVVRYFGARDNAFAFRHDGMAGQVRQFVRGVQEVTITTEPGEPTRDEFLSQVPVPRYAVESRDIDVTVMGPK